jgi:L-ascorbate metabolism protein UlaG (beta-lactamase superfamily)
MIDRIQWLGHGGFLIQGPPLIYINPYRVSRSIFHADLLLISHHHVEHCSQADISKLRGPNTILLGNELVAQEIEGCQIMRPWQSMMVERAGIKALPAYSPTGWQHPREDGGLGFIISLNYYDIYYAGDTQIIPEMDRIRPDIAIVPIDGNGTMTVSEAVDLVKKMRPRWVIPCNWGPGTEANARLFKQEVAGRSEVIIPSIATT